MYYPTIGSTTASSPWGKAFKKNVIRKMVAFCPRLIALVTKNWFHIDRDTETMLSIWWRHQMETFSALLALCAGNSPVTGEFPAQRSATWSFDVFFELLLNKRPSKQSWGWWFETPSLSLWRHSNDVFDIDKLIKLPRPYTPHIMWRPVEYSWSQVKWWILVEKNTMIIECVLMMPLIPWQ